MGNKGDRATSAAERFLAQVLPRLEPLGGVTSRRMFGGYGIFQRGQMFAIVSSGSELVLQD